MIDTNTEINEDFVFHELDTTLRSCKKNKSPGEDQLQYEMLQQLPKCSKKVVLCSTTTYGIVDTFRPTGSTPLSFHFTKKGKTQPTRIHIAQLHSQPQCAR